jgi:hypothetical protein
LNGTFFGNLITNISGFFENNFNITNLTLAENCFFSTFAQNTLLSNIGKDKITINVSSSDNAFKNNTHRYSFSSMFDHCQSLTDVNIVFNNIYPCEGTFEKIFSDCQALSKITEDMISSCLLPSTAQTYFNNNKNNNKLAAVSSKFQHSFKGMFKRMFVIKTRSDSSKNKYD